MLPIEERRQITELVRRWVVPAIGCTEPICVALAVSKATEVLGETPLRIEARLSANILKNAMEGLTKHLETIFAIDSGKTLVNTMEVATTETTNSENEKKNVLVFKQTFLTQKKLLPRRKV